MNRKQRSKRRLRFPVWMTGEKILPLISEHRFQRRDKDIKFEVERDVHSVECWIHIYGAKEGGMGWKYIFESHFHGAEHGWHGHVRAH